MSRDETIRFSVSLPSGLLDEMDRTMTDRGYASRSELVRDMIRARLVDAAWDDVDAEVHGVLAIVYDHHRRGLTDRLHKVQHDRYVHILCTQHVHLDHDRCLETIVLRGTPVEIERMALEIGGLKGVEFAELTRMAVALDRRDMPREHSDLGL